MMKNSPKDCYATVQKTVVVILERLQHVLHMENHIQNNRYGRGAAPLRAKRNRRR